VLLGVRLIRRIVDAVQLERDDLYVHVVLLSVCGDGRYVATSPGDVATIGTARATSVSPG
jgi:hypothetical protein